MILLIVSLVMLPISIFVIVFALRRLRNEELEDEQGIRAYAWLILAAIGIGFSVPGILIAFSLLRGAS